jgi:hypothetical protein
MRGGIERERHDLGAALGDRFLAALVVTAQCDSGDRAAGNNGGGGHERGRSSVRHWCAPGRGLGEAVGQDFQRAQHVVAVAGGNAVQ